MSKIYLSFYAWSRNRSPNDTQILIHFWKKIVTNNHFFLDQVCFCGLDILIHLNNFKKIVLIHCRLHKLCRLHKQPTIFRKRRSSNFGNFLSGSKWFTLDHKKTPDWFFTRSGSNFFIHSLWTICWEICNPFSKVDQFFIWLARVSWRSEKAKLSMNGINVPSQDPLRVGSDQITTDYEKSSKGDSRESRESRSSSISTLGDSTSLPREYD